MAKKRTDISNADLLEAVNNGFTKMQEQMDTRFAQVDARFEAIDQRFEAIDRRFEAIDRQFEGVDRRFDALDEKVEAIDKKLDQTIVVTDTHDRLLTKLQR